MKSVALIYKELPYAQEDINIRDDISECDYRMEHDSGIRIRQKTKDKRQKYKDKSKHEMRNGEYETSNRLSHQKTCNFSFKL
jgi:hypothetical protein